VHKVQRVSNPHFPGKSNLSFTKVSFILHYMFTFTCTTTTSQRDHSIRQKSFSRVSHWNRGTLHTRYLWNSK